jgi:hypothetical protein
MYFGIKWTTEITILIEEPTTSTKRSAACTIFYHLDMRSCV